ncbi:MAG: ATP-binding protein [Cyanobacteriota bacterium]|nr:ATP-binding protein [Cyanobacteriota bacterium]
MAKFTVEYDYYLPKHRLTFLLRVSKLTDYNKSPEPRKAQIQLNTGLSANDRVLSWFEGLDKKPIPKTLWLQCELALAEGFTNAVRHAHRELPPDTPIDLEVSIFSNSIEIRIWDFGPPFDLKGWLKNHPAPKIYAGGGRGIRLMRAIADDLSYTRTNDSRNCLLIIKNYAPDLERD